MTGSIKTVDAANGFADPAMPDVGWRALIEEVIALILANRSFIASLG